MFSGNSKPGAQAPGHMVMPGTSAPSLISDDMRINGDVLSDGDIQVDGSIEGDVRTRMLTVGAGARVKGVIEAETADIRGTVSGTINARKVMVSNTAKIAADIIHETLEIEAGAIVEGSFKRMDTASIPMIGSEKAASIESAAVPNPLAGKLKGAAGE